MLTERGKSFHALSYEQHNKSVLKIAKIMLLKVKKSLKFFNFLEDYFREHKRAKKGYWMYPKAYAHTRHYHPTMKSNSSKLRGKYLWSSSTDNQRKHSQLLIPIKSITHAGTKRPPRRKHNHLCVFDWLQMTSAGKRWKQDKRFYLVDSIE